MENSKLTDREKSLIVSEPSLPYEPNPEGLGNLLFNSFKANSSAIAQVDSETGQEQTYADLFHKCVRSSLNLLLLGITKADVICLCTHEHMNSCIPIVCGFFLGIKVIPLDLSLSFEDMMHVLKLIKPRITFASQDNEQVIDEIVEAAAGAFVTKVIVFGVSDVHTTFNEFLEDEDFLADEEVSEEKFQPLKVRRITDIGLLLCSTKASGNARVVCLGQNALMVQMNNARACWKLEKDNPGGFPIVLNSVTCSSGFGMTLLCCCLKEGLTRIVGPAKFEPGKIWHLIAKYNVSFVACTAHQAGRLHRAGLPEVFAAPRLRLLVTTGAALLRSDLLELRRLLPRCFVTNAYSQAEACGVVTAFDVATPRDIRDQYESAGSCGKAAPGVVCKIVDPLTNKILGPMQAGELRYKSNFLMTNYFKLPTAPYYEKDWLKSGDIAYYDRSGCFYVLDRFSDVFGYQNSHILPIVIERVLREHPAVKDAAVIGVAHEDPEVGKVPMGFVSLAKGMKDRVTSGDVRKYVDANVIDKLRLRGGLRIVKEIPLSSLGRAKRHELEDIVFEKDI